MVFFSNEPRKSSWPGLGLMLFFIKKNQELIGNDIVSVVQSFFIFGKLLKEVNHTFLTLIPKVSNSNLVDFRHISCCNMLYKAISKTLSNKLHAVISELISPNQSAFLKGEQISDCSLLDHKLIRLQEETISSRMLPQDRSTQGF